jgi:hypothetical protein
MPSTLSDGCGKRVSKNLGFLDVPIDVGGDVFDADPAGQLLAEESDVTADDRAEIDQRRHLPRLQQLQKLRKSFGGIGRFVRGCRGW